MRKYVEMTVSGLKSGQFGSGSDVPEKFVNGGGKSGLAVIVILVGVVALSVMFNTFIDSENESYDPNWSAEAIAQCEELVVQNLKSPSTAKFDTGATGGGTWIVTGTVDSEDSFGGTLQATFQCTVVIKGEDISRRLDSLD
jgi:hypothetical protein